MITLIAIILGTLNSLYLSLTHLTGTTQCLGNTGCESILSSSYATLLGIPVAILGLGYFLSLLIFHLSTPKKDDNYWQSLSAISLPAMLIALTYTAIQLFLIKGFCVFCLINFLLILIIAITGLKQISGLKNLNPFSAWKKPLPSILIGILLPIILFLALPNIPNTGTAATIAGSPISTSEIDQKIGIKLIESQKTIYQLRRQAIDTKIFEIEAKSKGVTLEIYMKSLQSKITITDAEIEAFYSANKEAYFKTTPKPLALTQIKNYLSSQKFTKMLSAVLQDLYKKHNVKIKLERPGRITVPKNPLGSPRMGVPNGKIRLVEFSDFECPYCERAHSALKTLLKDPELAPYLTIEFRHFPLTNIHKNAHSASIAAQCANKQNNFERYADHLFKNQKNLKEQGLYKKIATEIGLNIKEFEACLEDPATKEQVDKDIEIGATIGVTGTPTFFANGHMIKGVPTKEALLSSLKK